MCFTAWKKAEHVKYKWKKISLQMNVEIWKKKGILCFLLLDF